MVTSDDRGSYAREEPEEKHLTGKIFTQRIERNNPPLRTRIRRPARKTICFPRSVEIHEKIIGSFIEKHMSAVWRHYRTTRRWKNSAVIFLTISKYFITLIIGLTQAKKYRLQKMKINIVNKVRTSKTYTVI